MNPIEMILAQLMGGTPNAERGVGAFAAPQLASPILPQGAMPRASGDRTKAALSAESADSTMPAGPSIFEDGNNAPHMILRRLLTGANADPVQSPPSEPSQAPAAVPPPAQPPPPGVRPGSMPTPSDPSRQAMFSAGGQQVPSASPMPPPMPPRQAGSQPPVSRGAAPQPVTAVPTTGAPAQATPEAGGLMGFLKSPAAGFLRDLLTSSMAGAATATGPRAGNIGAFGTGYTTAENSMRARQQQQAAAELAKQKLGFDQTMAVRKDSRDERGATREDEKLGISRADQKRKTEESKVRNQVAVEKLMKVRDDGTLPLAAKIKIQDQLNQYADKVNKNGLMSQAELDGALTKERSRLEQYYGLTKPASSGGSSGAAAPTQQAVGPDGKVVTFTLQNGQWVPTP